MDIIQIFKKALSLTWRYRALWLFGSLLALTVNSAPWWSFTRRDDIVLMQNRIILSDTATFNFPGQGVTIDFSSPGPPVIQVEGLEPGWLQDQTEDVRINDVWSLLISIGVILLVWIFVIILLRYTSKAALIRMVDEYERSESMVSLRQGFRLGWSKVAWNLFLIDLVVILPLVLVFVLVFTLTVSPFFLFGLESFSESVAGVIAILLLVSAGSMLFMILLFAASVILSITRPVMHQACAVDGLNVMASIRQGFRLLRTRFGGVISTWLIWLAVRLAWAIAIIPALIILSPVLFLTILVGVMTGALLALIAAGIASQFVGVLAACIIGVLSAIPLFFFVAFSPLFFLSGLVEVFKSNFWTLSYREFRPLDSSAPRPTDQPESVRPGAVTF